MAKRRTPARTRKLTAGKPASNGPSEYSGPDRLDDPGGKYYWVPDCFIERLIQRADEDGTDPSTTLQKALAIGLDALDAKAWSASAPQPVVPSSSSEMQAMVDQRIELEKRAYAARQARIDAAISTLTGKRQPSVDETEPMKTTMPTNERHD